VTIPHSSTVLSVLFFIKKDRGTLAALHQLSNSFFARASPQYFGQL
jgi:hypothetical protein